MILFVKAASIVGSLVALIALLIVLVKALIGFVGFLAFAIKLIIVLGFLVLFAFVGLMLFRAWQDKQRAA